MKLERGYGTVKLEIEDDELSDLLSLLASHGRKDLVKRFITRLYVEEFISRQEAFKWAAHYGVESFEL